MTVLNWPQIIWRWLNKAGFFVTMLGVLAAFWLTGIGEQKALDKVTKQRLHIAVLESQYNGTIAKRIIDDCANTSGLNFSIDRLDSTAATAAFEDTNVLLFLPHYKVSLLRSYANAIATLNQALQVHQSVIERLTMRR